jgi:hypothetical protein
MFNLVVSQTPVASAIVVVRAAIAPVLLQLAKLKVQLDRIEARQKKQPACCCAP